MKTCGLDVHKDIIFCAIYDGKVSVVKQFSSFTPDLRDMCQYIKGEGVATVAMESTGIYIEAIRTVLRHNGMKALVVNPSLIKQMPGRKRDVKDAEWIAKLHYKQMLSESFVPDGTLSALRAYTREHRKLVQRRSQVLTKIDRLLVAGGIRLSSCVSSLDTKSFQKVARAVSEGETDPEKLEKKVQGCTKHKRDGTLRKALTGCIETQHVWRLKIAMEELDLYDRLIADALEKMEELTEAHYHEASSSNASSGFASASQPRKPSSPLPARFSSQCIPCCSTTRNTVQTRLATASPPNSYNAKYSTTSHRRRD